MSKTKWTGVHAGTARANEGNSQVCLLSTARVQMQTKLLTQLGLHCVKFLLSGHLNTIWDYEKSSFDIFVKSKN